LRSAGTNTLKKFMYAIFCLGGTSVIMAGCTLSTADDSLTVAIPVDVNPVTASDTDSIAILLEEMVPVFPDGISLSFEGSTYSVGVEVLNAVWKNDTDREILFGQVFSIQKKVNGDWETLNTINGVPVFPLIAYRVSPHSQMDWTYRLHNYGCLEAGCYRIASSFWLYSPIPTGDPRGYRVYAEFMVA